MVDDQQDWRKAYLNPAAPKGAQQVAQAAQGYQQENPQYAQSSLGKWADAYGLSNSASAWYTGANAGGTENGWDNGFRAIASKQYDEALQDMKANPNAFEDWMKRDDATGVVTWGERRQPGDTTDAPKYGDVYNNGKRVANVYDDFEEKDANLMLAPWVLDGKTQSKIFASPERDQWLAQTLEEQRSNTEKGLGARDFQEQVDKEQKGLLEGGSEAGFIGAGAASGAAIGAGIGSIVPVLGTAAGALIGGVVGGLTTAANEDQITELAARANVQAKMADEQFGKFQKYTTLLSGYSQVGTRLINPISNTVQGIADAMYSDVGDGKEGFYAVDSDGNRKAGAVLQAMDVGATLADSLLQFTNPIGLAAYSATMTGNIVGEVGTLATTGESFDLRSGNFHDHEGFKENAAAWANIGIDAVQLGMARGITAAGQSARTAFTGATREEVAAAPTLLGRTKLAAQEKLPLQWGGLRQGQRAEIIGGSRYVIDEATGKAVSKGFSLSSLAPSELTQRTAVGLKTRITGPQAEMVAADRALKLSADDFYQNAVILASGRGSRFTSALLNGFGEGAEEWTQALLEPASFSEKFNAQDAARAFLYGAASGIGMSVGTSLNMPSQSDRLYGRFLAKGLFTQEQMPKDTFMAMPLDKQKTLAKLDAAEAQNLKKVRDAFTESLEFRTINAGAMGRHAMLTGVQSEFDRRANKANPNFTSVTKFIPNHIEDVVDDQGNRVGQTPATDEGGVSAWRQVHEIRRNAEAFGVHVKTLQGDIAKGEAELQVADLPEDRKLFLEQNLPRWRQMLTDAVEMEKISSAVAQQLNALFQQLGQVTTKFDGDQIIDQMNRVVRDAHAGELTLDGVDLTPEQKSVTKTAIEVLGSRDPSLGEGSIIPTVPIIRRALAYNNADGVYEVHQGVIKSQEADFDGDNMRTRRDLMLDRKSRERLRAGEQFLQPVQDDKGNNGYEVIMDEPDGHLAMMQNIVRALGDARDEVSGRAQDTIDNLMEILWKRYRDVVPDQGAFVTLLENFQTGIEGGSTAAVKAFRDGLATLAAPQIQQRTLENGTAYEWPELQQIITAKLDQIQKSYAGNMPEYEYTPGESVDTLDKSVQGAWLREKQLFDAATISATLDLIRSGVSANRAGMAVHFGAFNALVEAELGDKTLAPAKMQEITEWYEARHGGRAQSVLDEQGARDGTTLRVIDDLKDLMAEAGVQRELQTPQAMMLFALTRVQDFDYVPGEPVVFRDRDVSLLQLLLRRSVRIDRGIYAEILDSNDTVRNRLNTLNALTFPKNNDKGHSTAAQEAFEAVFQDVPTSDLLGDAAMFVGNLSFRGLKMKLLAMDSDDRRAWFNSKRRKAAYIGREGSTNPPYTVAEATAGKLTPFRAFIDALEAVTNKSAPKRQEAATTAQRNFVSGISSLHTLIPQYYARLQGADKARFDSLSRGEQVIEIINSDDAMARDTAAVIPTAVTLGAFRLDSANQVINPANWVVDMFGKDPQEALASYVVHTTLAEYLLAGVTDSTEIVDTVQAQVREDEDNAKRGHKFPRNYAKLKTNFARLIYRLASEPDGLKLSGLLREMHQAKSLDRLMDDAVNTKLYNGGFPKITPLFDDVSETDVSFESSWQLTYPGAQQREALAKFADSAARYSDRLVTAVAVQQSDTQTANDIKAFLLNAAGKDIAVPTGAKQRTMELAQMVANAQRFWTSVGPSARDNDLAVSQSGVRQTHEKGTADPASAPFGNARVLGPGGNGKVSILNALDDLTAVSVQDVLANPSRLSYQSMRIQLDDLSIIEWAAPDETIPGHDLDRPRPDLLQYAELLANPATAGFAKQVLGLSFYEPTQNGDLQKVAFRGTSADIQHSLVDMLGRSNFAHVFPQLGVEMDEIQADEYLTLLSGAILKDTYTLGANEQAELFDPIQMAMQEIVVAYAQSGDKLTESSAANERDYVKKATARTVQVLSDLYRQDPQLAATAIQQLKERLRDRTSSAAPTIMNIAKTDEDRLTLLQGIGRLRLEAFNERAAALNSDLESATDDVERAAIIDQQERLAAESQNYNDSLNLALTDLDVDATLAMFTVNEANEEDALRQKRAILEYLGAGRMGYFTEKDTEVFAQARAGMSSEIFRDGGVPVLDSDVWTVLSRAAATAFLAERAQHVGTQVSLVMLEGSEGGWKDLARYYDYTYSYLLGHLSKVVVLEAAQEIAKRPGYFPNISVDEAVNEIDRLLFSDRRLKPWNSTLVGLHIANRDSLLSSGVEMAVAIPGMLPTTMATQMAATERDLSIPTDPPTTFVFTRRALDSAELSMDLNGIFIQRAGGATLVYKNADGVDEEYDLFADPLLADAWGSPADAQQAAVRNSGFVVTNAQRVENAVDKALSKIDNRNADGEWTVRFVGFHPQNRPADPKWQNNIFYTGVGREGVVGSKGSVLAETYFGINGIYQTLTQRPLWAQKQHIAAHSSTTHIEYDLVKRIETSPRNIYQQLKAKARLLMSKEYDFGSLQTTDLPAIMTQLRMRHVVEGKEADGRRVIWSVDRAIASQREGSPEEPLTDMKLVPLSERAMNTLLGDRTGNGLAITAPSINLQNVSSYTQIGADALIENGFEKVGLPGTFTGSRLEFLTQLAAVDGPTQRRQQKQELFAPHIQTWRKQEAEELRYRNESRGFDTSRQVAHAEQLIRRSFDEDMLASIMARLGLPQYGGDTSAKDALDNSIVQSLLRRMEVSTGHAAFTVQVGVRENILDGVLSEISFDDTSGHGNPVFGDYAFIDLSMMDFGQTEEKNIALAVKLVKRIAERGLAIVFINGKGHGTLSSALRSAVIDQLGTHEEVTDRMFMPIMDDSGATQTERAMLRTLTEVRKVSKSSLRLEFRSDMLTQANQNASYYLPERNINLAQVDTEYFIQRSNILSRRPPGFFSPNTSEQRKFVRDKLVDLLDEKQNPLAFDHILKLAGGGSGAKRALKRLHSQLTAGDFPTDKGQTFGFGFFDVLLGPGDVIYLGRQGYKSLTSKRVGSPLRTEVMHQAATGIGQDKPVGGVDGLGIAVSPNEVDETLNSNTGIIDDVLPGKHGAGSRVLLRVPVTELGAKAIAEKDGMKHGLIPLPEEYRFPLSKVVGDMGLRLAGGIDANRKKESFTGLVKNSFRNAFLLSGVSFRSIMIEYITGAAPTEENIEREWAKVQPVLKAVANNFQLSADAVAAGFRAKTTLESQGQLLKNTFTTLGIDQTLTDWVDRTRTDGDRIADFAEILIGSLMVDGVQLEHVIGTPGFANTDVIGQIDSGLMPPVFTDALDDYNKPEMRDMLFDMVNQRLGDGFTLLPDWTFVVKVEHSGKVIDMPGELKMTTLVLDDAHPDMLVQSDKASTSTAVSQFAAAQAAVLFSGGLAHRSDFDLIDQYLEGKNGLNFDKDRDLWSQMQNDYDPNVPTMARSDSERVWAAESRRKHALYLHDVDRSAWDAEDQDKWGRLARLFSTIVFDTDAYSGEADYLVRQFLGARGRDERSDTELEGVDDLDAKSALAALAIIVESVQDGYSPLYRSSANPLVDSDFLMNAFEANKDRANNRWAPRVVSGVQRIEAKMSKDAWVNAILGQLKESEENFEQAFRQDLDGAWLTYEGVIDDLKDIPASTSLEVNIKLLDPATQQLAASLDPATRSILASTISLEGTTATLDAILTGGADFAGATAKNIKASGIADRLDRIKAWKAKEGLQPSETTVSDYLEWGAWYTKRHTNTHRILRNLTNLRIGLALFNPALLVASIPESIIRNSLDNTVSLLMGQSLSATGRAAAAVGEKLGVETRFTPAQLKKFQQLIQVMGSNPEFIQMVYKDLMFAHELEPGVGAVGGFLEKFARLGSNMQDAQWSMFAGTVARRYLETAMAYLEFDPSNAIDIDAFIAQMNKDPLFLKKQTDVEGNPLRGLSAHSSALNAVAQVRSLKPNIVGKAVRGIYGPMTENGSAAINFAGHLLKWPLIFTNYTAGAAMFLTGTSGMGDFVAAALHGRQNLGATALQSLMRNQPDRGAPTTFDTSDVLEGLDLSRSFIRSGVTWSGYMAYVLMGGLGLSGEDEEARRRRLLATYYGAPLQYDPLDPANDFRTAGSGAIFLDGLPGPLHWIFDRPDGAGGQRAMMAPHWIVKQFISPLVGIERFMSTGDLNQLEWGFTEAASVMPQSVLRLFNEAKETSRDLARQAQDETQKGDQPEAMNSVNRLLISIVGTYERGFMESSFVNTIRNGSDKYDRDPWVQVKTNDQGEVVRDDKNNPEQTDALTSYIDPETGEIGQAYGSRDYWSAQMHQYAENNATFAGIASLFTGFSDSQYLRRNMAVKEKNVALKGLSKQQAEGMFLKEFDTEGGAAALTDQESRYAPSLSEIDANNREVLTKDGARVVFESVYAGTVDFESGSLRGIFVPYEMRQEIQADLVDKLIKDGIDLGLSETSAKYRARRIWYGHDEENPDQPGLREIVWSDKVAQQPTQSYNQLNTTYVLGPGGKPYATGVRRDSWLEALGVNPLGKGMIANTDGGMNVDGKLNSTDEVLNLNTGLRALERNEAKSLEPDDKALDEQLAKPVSGRTGGGYGGGGYSRSAGTAYSPYIAYKGINAFPDSRPVYGNDIPFINLTNAQTRRATTRRERISSERQRLKQWQ